MSDQIAGFIGLYGGALMGLIGLFYGRAKAKKQRALDETHDHIWQQSRSLSWYATLISIYILFSLHLFGFPLSIASVLGILLIVHMGAWAFSGAMLSFLLYRESDIKVFDFLLGVLIIILAALFFIMLIIFIKKVRKI